MRYEILRPPSPIDPRRMRCTSLDMLYQLAPMIFLSESESEVAKEVRAIVPSSPAMPMPLTIGSGAIWVLGFCEDPERTYSPTDQIPFVLLVRAVADSDRDKRRVRENRQFDQEIWIAKASDSADSVGHHGGVGSSYDPNPY